MVSQSPVTRVTDIIPREYLTQPFSEDAFSLAVKRFIEFALPLCVGASLSFALGTLMYFLVAYWLAVLFFCLGICLAAGIAFVFQAYWSERGDLQARRRERKDIVIAVNQVIENLTVQQIVVQRGGTLNTGGTTYSALDGQPLSTQPVLAINETYDLALKIIRTGIEAWIANGNKRPKPKPISADAITTKFHVRREKWDEAMQLIEEAGVFDKPDDTYWRPNYATYEKSKEQLDAHLKKTYFLKTNGSRQVWMR